MKADRPQGRDIQNVLVIGLWKYVIVWNLSSVIWGFRAVSAVIASILNFQ